MVTIINTGISVLIIYISPLRQQRSTVQLCARCKQQEDEVAELKAGLANALNRIAALEGEKKHSIQVG